MSSEKAPLDSMVLPTWQQPQQQEQAPKRSWQSPARLVLKGLALWVVGYVAAQALYQAADATDIFHRHPRSATALNDESVCKQSPVLHPSRYNVTDVYTSDARSRIVDWLSGAVQIPTESFDTMGPIGEDERWEVFAPFHAYLEKKFPKVYEHLKVEKVSTYALAYEWTGSDNSKKPLMLTAHQGERIKDCHARASLLLTRQSFWQMSFLSSRPLSALGLIRLFRDTTMASSSGVVDPAMTRLD